MSLETFLEGVRVELATDLQIEVVDGEITGPLENIPPAGYGCIFPDGETSEELVEDVMWEELRIVARIFLPITQEFAPEQPIDTSDLIDLRARAIAALKDKQTNQFSVWFFRLERSRIDTRRRYVELVLVGRQRAEFTAGA